MEDRTGCGLIVLERRYQLESGRDAAGDDKHTGKQLANLATLLLSPYDFPAEITDPSIPWAAREASRIYVKHKHDPIMILTIAGACVAAEIDRLLRLKQAGSDNDE